MVDVLNSAQWTPLQALLKSREMAESGQAAIIVLKDEQGHWHSVTSSVGVGDLLTASEVLRMRAQDALKQV